MRPAPLRMALVENSSLIPSPLTIPSSIRHNLWFAGGVMKALGLLLLFLAMNAYAQTAPPTVAEAQEFMNKAEAQFADLIVKVNRATWCRRTSSPMTPRRWQRRRS